MRRIAILFSALLLLSCQGKKQGNQPKTGLEAGEKVAQFEVNEEIHNFGILSAGEIVIFSFVLKNTGNEDLVVNKVEADCGCLAVNTENKPVAPGDEKIIEVKFDTSGLYGKQYKSILVEGNFKEKTKYLAIVADIKNEIFDNNN